MNSIHYWRQRLEWLVSAAQIRFRRFTLGRRFRQLELGGQVKIEGGVLWRLDPKGQCHIDSGTSVRRGVEIKVDERAQLSVGRNVHLGPWCTISSMSQIEIGDDCLIAENVSIRDHDHVITHAQTPYATQGFAVAPVRLGRNVWLGKGVTIVKGVELGDNCVVGANAVVTRSFPSNSVIAGVPARLIRTIAPSNVEDKGVKGGM